MIFIKNNKSPHMSVCDTNGSDIMVCVTFTQIPQDLYVSVEQNVFDQASVRIMKNMKDTFLKNTATGTDMDE